MNIYWSVHLIASLDYHGFNSSLILTCYAASVEVLTYMDDDSYFFCRVWPTCMIVSLPCMGIYPRPPVWSMRDGKWNYPTMDSNQRDIGLGCQRKVSWVKICFIYLVFEYAEVEEWITQKNNGRGEKITTVNNTKEKRRFVSVVVWRGGELTSREN